MKIGNNAGIMLGKARLLRQAKMRAASGSRQNSAGRLSGNGRSSGINNVLNSLKNTGPSGITDTVSALQARSNYTVIQRCAESLEAIGSKLFATGEDSLFGKALWEPDTTEPSEESGKAEDSENAGKTEDSSESGKAPTAEELAEYKKRVVDEINSFINEYNTMVQRMGQVEDTTQSWYLKELGSYVKANRAKLLSLGITQNANGTLRVDQETLENADVERMKQVFGEKGSFADKVVKLCSSIGPAAEAGAASALKSGYLGSNYNRYGQDNGNSWYGSGANWLA